MAIRFPRGDSGTHNAEIGQAETEESPCFGNNYLCPLRREVVDGPYAGPRA